MIGTEMKLEKQVVSLIGSIIKYLMKKKLNEKKWRKKPL